MNAKLDFTAAWNDAVAMLKQYKEVILPVAGVFILFPTILMAYLVPQPEMVPEQPESAALAMLTQMLSDMAPWFFLLVILSTIGNLAIYRLVLHQERPTVGQALSMALTLFIPFFVASILSGLAIFFGFLFLIIPGVYLAIKFLLAGPAIAAEDIKNPIAALQRSWALTKGNSLYIFGFYFILIFVSVIIYLIVAGILSVLISSILPENIAFLLTTIIDGILQTVLSVLFLFIGMAVYRQLSGSQS
jgi:hypothetical protein